MAKRTRRHTRRSIHRRKRGGACDIQPAPVNATANDLGLATQQSLAQGEQFAVLTRAYHGGRRRKASRKTHRRRRSMKGGMAPLSIFGGEGVDVQRGSAHLLGQDMALNQAAAYSLSASGQDNPYVPNMGPAQRAGARKSHKSRKGNRKSHRKSHKSRKGNRKSHRKSHRKAQRGGMAIYDGAPYTQTSSDMLLADDPALQAQAKQIESPTWTGVANGTYL